MPKIKISKTSGYSSQIAFEKVSTMLRTDHDLRKLDPKYVCEFDPKKLSGTAVGKQFNAKLAVTAQGEKSEISIEVDLPLILIAVKGLVEKTLQKKVDEALA